MNSWFCCVFWSNHRLFKEKSELISSGVATLKSGNLCVFFRYFVFFILLMSIVMFSTSDPSSICLSIAQRMNCALLVCVCVFV